MAGHQTGLPRPGACASTTSDCNIERRARVPLENIAAVCRPMTKTPPTMAAVIWAASRVRLGPIHWKSLIVSTTASEVVTSEIAANTP